MASGITVSSPVLKGVEVLFSKSLISTGQLPAYRPLKKKILIKRSDLNKLIEAKRVGADLDKIVDEVVAEVTGNGK
jgi:hypothetical protein